MTAPPRVSPVKPGRKVADGADVLLELRGDRALDRPVAAVVHARRDLVDQRPGRRCEEFDREHSDVAERFGDAQRRFARFGDLQRRQGAARHGRTAQDALAMLVLPVNPRTRAGRRPSARE